MFVATVIVMNGNREPEVNFGKEAESIYVKNLDDKSAKIKEGGRDCRNKTVKRKKKSEDNEIGCVSGKRMRSTHEEEQDENMEKEDINVGSAHDRKSVEAISEKSGHVELVIENGEILGTRFDDKSRTKLDKRKTGVNNADLVFGKRFTKEEDEIIKKAVLDYVEKHKLGEQGVEMVMNCREHPRLRGCWNEIGAETLPHRPQKSIYHRAQKIISIDNRGKWTQEEIDYIKEMHRKRGADWTFIAKQLGRYRVHVGNKYMCTKLPNQRKGRWSQDECQALFDLVHADLETKVLCGEKKLLKHGMLRDNIRWTDISDKLGTRSQPRCCLKWYQSLSSPMVVDGTWADADDYRMLIALYNLDDSCEEEVDWDSLLEHRKGDLCRKRWKQMVRHIGERERKSFAEQVEVLYLRYCPQMPALVTSHEIEGTVPSLFITIRLTINHQ